MKATLYTFGLLALVLLFGGDIFAQNAIVVEPLTSIGEETGSQTGIGPLANKLYQYGVGIGAILAVLIIMYGGFRYMTSEAVGEKNAGREDIQRAILGLLLVLSPVIVFGVINQDILNLEFNFNRLGDYERNISNGGGGNTPTAPSFCQDYSNFRKVELDLLQGQECRDVLGGGWLRLGDSCCDAANATGSGSCCGFNEELVPPEPVEIKDFAVGFVFGELLDTPSLACKSSDSRDFDTIGECNTERGLLEGEGAAIQISCEGDVYEPPIPAANWEPLADLPWCSN